MLPSLNSLSLPSFYYIKSIKLLVNRITFPCLNTQDWLTNITANSTIIYSHIKGDALLTIAELSNCTWRALFLMQGIPKAWPFGIEKSRAWHWKSSSSPQQRGTPAGQWRIEKETHYWSQSSDSDTYPNHQFPGPVQGHVLIWTWHIRR
jgi:hypothetical protein